MGLTEDHLGGVGGFCCIRVKEGHQIVLDDILDEGTAEANEGDTKNDGEERKPSVGRLARRVEDWVMGEGTELIEPKMAAEEQDAENADK